MYLGFIINDLLEFMIYSFRNASTCFKKYFIFIILHFCWNWMCQKYCCSKPDKINDRLNFYTQQGFQMFRTRCFFILAYLTCSWFDHFFLAKIKFLEIFHLYILFIFCKKKFGAKIFETPNFMTVFVKMAIFRDSAKILSLKIFNFF